MGFETYERGPVKLVLADCLEFLPTLEAGSFDSMGRNLGCAMDDDDDFDGFDDDDDGEPTGSCDECDSNLYRDDEYYFHGLVLCGQCYWERTRA